MENFLFGGGQDTGFQGLQDDNLYKPCLKMSKAAFPTYTLSFYLIDN